MNRTVWRYLVLASVLLLVSCGGSGIGCSGCASSCGGNPNYKFKGSIAKDSIQVRLTQGGVDFITSHLKPIIENLLNKAGQSFDCSAGGITFPTQSLGNGPKSGGQAEAPSGSNCGIKTSSIIPPRVTCTGSSPSSTWFYAALKQSSLCGALNTNSVKVQLNESDNSVSVTFDIPEIRVRSNAPDVGFCYKGGVPSAVSGLVGGDICAGAKAALKKVELILKQLGVTMKLGFVTDPTTGKVGLKLNSVKIASSTKFTVDFDGCQSITIPINIPIINQSVNINLGGSLCSLALQGIEGLINGTQFLQPLIFPLIEGLIANQFKSLDLLADVKVEMEVPLGGLLGSLSLPGLQNSTPLGLLAQPGKALGIVNAGLSMGMDSGFEASEKNPCVPVRPEPQTQPGPVPALSGSYHMAAALSVAATNRALWAAYHTGVLCLKLRSADLGGLGGISLNAGVLSLLAPELTQVVPQDAPILIAIQPTQPPDATFGTGQKVGGKTDSTIKLRIPDFGISFYVMLHDRYVRVFKMLVDAKLGISLVSSPTNDLEVAVDADAIELTNARATDAYLVKINDPNSLLKLIVNILTQTLGSNGITIPVDLSDQISKALGVPINLKIDQVGREGAAGDWLALKMTMSDKTSPLLPSPQTVAQIHRPSGLYKKWGDRIIPTGEILIDVPQYLGPHELEYQYRVDFGVWSSFHDAPLGVLRVRHDLLKLLGRHKVYIRARIKGDYRTREEVPAVVDVMFDPLAPKVQLQLDQNTLRVDASDQVTKRDRLEYAYKHNGAWVSMSEPGLFLTKELNQAHRIAIRVTDQAGNSRILHWSPARKAIVGASTQTSPEAPKAAWGCSTSPDTVPGDALWLVMLILLGLGLKIRTSRS